jgi:predicted permease
VLTFRVGLPETDYRDRRAAVAAHTAILDRLARLPGVASVSAATCLPLIRGGCLGNTVFVQRATETARPTARSAPTLFHGVAAGYAETLGIRLLRGRHLDRDDIERGEPNVVVDQAFADAYFKELDPVGQRIASSRPPAQGPPAWLTIVGVVSSTVSDFLGEPKPTPKVYMPMSIAGGPEIPVVALVGPNVATMNYVIRARVDPLSLVAQSRRVVDTVDATLALAEVGTLEQSLARSSAQASFTMVLLAIAASVTLVLGVIGIYGVMSYIVSQRRSEIGIRLALGATPATVVAMIVQQGATVAAAGLATGAAMAAAGSRLIASLLFDVSPRDPGIFAIAIGLLFAVALFACWLPSRRAARVNAIEALRAD